MRSRHDWALLTRESKPWTRWWWLGSAVDEKGLTDALQAYADVGLGGVEICPIYGARGAEQRFVPFLSPEWVKLVRHTVNEAHRLGMAVDLTTGTGWPFGGPMIDAQHASCRLTLTRDDAAGGATFEKTLSRGALEYAVALDANGVAIDLADRVRNAKLHWEAPAGGAWQVVTAVRQMPIQKVKRAAPGGEGNVVDPFSTNALKQYLAAFDAAFEKTGWPRLDGQFHDSFEYYNANWTPQLYDEFARRRRYDLRSHLPALAGVGDQDTVLRVRCDYRQTMAELHLDYVVHWMEWCHGHGGVAREQAHGSPANLVDLYAACDVPETECFGPPDERALPIQKFASSAAHLAGRPITSAESFTWLGEHFQITLADAKAEADYLFLAGVNRLVFHGIAYSPPDLAWPGWLFYASTHFGPAGGLWRDLPAFTAYLARCQSVLQSGRPSCDVLLYFPIYDFWQGSGQQLITFPIDDKGLMAHPSHAAALALWRGGYQFDQVSDHFLSTANTANGVVQIGSMRYTTVVVPPCRVMPVETMRRLVELADAGVTVIFQEKLPDDVPGLQHAAARRAELRSLLAKVDALRAKRRVAVTPSLEKSLKAFDTPREAMADSGLLCQRRAHTDGHSYFIVNRGTAAYEGWAVLGTAAVGALLLDPRDERRRGVAAIRHREGRAEVYLQLTPGESIVLQTFTNQLPLDDHWFYSAAAGEARTIDGPWRVTFIDGGPALPKAYEASRPASWTDRDDPEAKRFSGAAVYAVEFDHTPTREVDDWRLELGRVCESARVRVNGQGIATVWTAPFSLLVGSALRAGRNTIEIEVTNLAANRIADLDRRGVPWKQFHEINFVDRTYQPFNASKWPLRESGLLGPVRLVPVRRLLPR